VVGAFLRALRPKQWLKNGIVFAGVIFAQKVGDPQADRLAIWAFILFCLLSSAVYLVNDLVDLKSDRLHPIKRHRPLASGALPASVGVAAAAVFGVGALAASFAVNVPFGWLAGAYVALNLAYSFGLKHVVIVDVFAVALGFVIRAAAGAEAIQVTISPWLLICTVLLALFLALSKRRHELVLLEANAGDHRRSLAEYSPYLLDQMIAVVTASCLTAYAFYTLAPETVEKYRTDRLALTIPIVIYGIFRYLYLVHRKEQGGSPSDVLLTDWPLLAAVALWAAAVVLIVYTAPGLPVPRGR
jgi:4-hydroxybenzoate polyprenyltransferase